MLVKGEAGVLNSSLSLYIIVNKGTHTGCDVLLYYYYE